jgi:hypothetical protein
VKEKKIGSDSLPYKGSTEKNRNMHYSLQDDYGVGNSLEEKHEQPKSGQNMRYQNTTIENLEEIENLSSYESNEDEKQGDRLEEAGPIWEAHEHNEGAFPKEQESFGTESEQLMNLHIKTIQ